MTSRDFCYWLQGYFELRNEEKLTSAQIETIKKHLRMVFKHEIDPSFGDKKHLDSLIKIHNGTLQPEINC
jgi:uncharacterized protein YfkK (UPF0435 family)